MNFSYHLLRMSAVFVLALIFPYGLPAVGGFEGAEGELPLSKLVLFSSGVGYFQRDGQVEGEVILELQSKTAEINDLLKSMVLLDFDGVEVTGINYSSRDPVSRTLKTFALDLTGNPGLAAILSQTRAEFVEIKASETISGTIVGVESKTRKDNGSKTEFFLNLLTRS